MMVSSQSSGEFYPSWEQVCANSEPRVEKQNQNRAQERIETWRRGFSIYELGLSYGMVNCLSWGYVLISDQEGFARPGAVASVALGVATTVGAGVAIVQESRAAEQSAAPK